MTTIRIRMIWIGEMHFQIEHGPCHLRLHRTGKKYIRTTICCSVVVRPMNSIFTWDQCSHTPESVTFYQRFHVHNERAQILNSPTNLQKWKDTSQFPLFHCLIWLSRSLKISNGEAKKYHLQLKKLLLAVSNHRMMLNLCQGVHYLVLSVFLDSSLEDLLIVSISSVN